MNDIRGLDHWENETREFNRQSGDIRMRVGIGMVEALENWYRLYKEKPTPRNRREYLLWRLRLHRAHNNNPEILQELDELLDVGLYDDEVGKTMWDIPAEGKTGFHTGFNWRRDSGNALRGGKARKERASSDMAEPNDGQVSLDPTDTEQ